MYDTVLNPEGGYRYAKGVFQYSAGVCAEPGFRIERVQFASPPRLEDGFARIVAHLDRKSRPNASLCAIELRCPTPLSEDGFLSFNRAYVNELARIGLNTDNGNPIARTMVAPKFAPPEDVVIWAFSYTVPDDRAGDDVKDFVIAGSGEAPEGRGNYRDHIIQPGDVSPQGLRIKADWVLGEMERRMASFGQGWKDTTSTQLYTLHDIHDFLEDEIARRGAMARGLLWHLARPPVSELDYEMDVRSVRLEIQI